jgi:RecA-family ATPase
LTEVPGEGRFEPDPDLRVLTSTKANYSRRGNEIRIRYDEDAGLFKPVEDAPTGLDALARDAVADDTFLRLLRLHEEQKIEVSPNFCASYAPKVFAAHSQSAGIGKRAFKAAMERLLASKKGLGYRSRSLTIAHEEDFDVLSGRGTSPMSTLQTPSNPALQTPAPHRSS